MLIRKAFKYRLKTNRQNESKMAQFAGCCRFVWNKALALQKERLEAGEYCLSYVQMAALLTEWRNSEETIFLREAPVHPLQQTLKNLDKALKEAFNKKNPKRFPRFKKKGLHDSFKYPDPKQFKLDGNRIFLPKLGWIRFFKSRDIEGLPKNVTVSRQGKHWFASIQVETEIGQPVHPSESVIGIDMGVKRFATMSDGTFIEPLSSFHKLEKKLAREQHKLSRKAKGSNNRSRQKAKVCQIHIKIANARNDFIHKASTTISKSHAVVVLEDLRIRNMSHSAKGDLDEPGRSVRAKSGLNKSILDQGWYEFRRQLEYKQSWLGGMVIAVPAKNTSRTCPACGLVSAANRRTQSRFACVQCGFVENADFVAATNILAVGHTVLACGEAVRPKKSARAASVKQESPVL